MVVDTSQGRLMPDGKRGTWLGTCTRCGGQIMRGSETRERCPGCRAHWELMAWNWYPDTVPHEAINVR